MLFVGNVIDMAFTAHGRIHYGPRSAAGSLARWLGGTGAGPIAPSELEGLAGHALLRAARDLPIGPVADFPALLGSSSPPPNRRYVSQIVAGEEFTTGSNVKVS